MNTPIPIFPPLHLAVMFDSLGIVKLLVENGADVNARDYIGETPLLSAILLSRSGIIEFLITNGIGDSQLPTSVRTNVNVVDNDGKTPLHITARRREIGTVRLLLKANAEVDAQCNDGWTPLHYAVKHNNLEIVELLMVAGANPLKKTNDGRTALDNLNVYGDPRIAKFLRSYTRSS